MVGVVLEVGSAEEELDVVLEVGERVIVDWLEDRLLEDRLLEDRLLEDRLLEGTVLEVDRRSDDVLEAVEERLGTVDEDRELVSLEEDNADVVVLAAESDDEDTEVEVWDELDITELVGPDELVAPVEEPTEFELEPAADGVAEELSEDVMLDMTEERMELMLDRSALFVMEVTGTNDELSLFTDVMTDDEAEVVEVDACVVLGVVGLLEVVEVVVLTTSPLLTDVTVTPLTVTVVGTVTLAVDTVTVVLPRTVVVTVGAV